MRYFKIAIIIALSMGIVAFISEKLSASKQPSKVKGSIYDLKATALDGAEIDFSRFKGKYILIVNTASKCGYTPQYKDLEALHKNYGDKVAVLGFPANNFLWQEPGSDAEIESFCEKNYGVTFQMFSKISVKGKDKHPVYEWLEAKTGKSPGWNFCKYLVDREGNRVTFFPSKVNPLDAAIVDAISK
jgi:glutathione peroxidase